MAASGYIELKRTLVDEPVKLTLLKSKFNLYATQLNLLGYGLSETESDELLDKINEVETQIKAFNH
jgi:hypothetical protein